MALVKQKIRINKSTSIYRKLKVVVNTFIILLIITLAVTSFKLGLFLYNTGHLVFFTHDDGVIVSNIKYGKSERNILDLYIPENIDENNDNGLILFLHGGAWTTGDKSLIQAYSKKMVKEGYIAANMNYSYLDINNGVSVFHILDEITLALEKIEDLSYEYNLNVTQVALCGYSAGGHLTLLYGYTKEYESPFPIKFIAEFVAPIDFHPDAWLGVNNQHNIQTVSQMVSIGSGLRVDTFNIDTNQTERLIYDLSPLYNITHIAPPTLMAYGLKDDLQDSRNGLKLKRALDTLNIRNDYIEFENSGHYLDKDKNKMDLYFEYFIDYAEEYFGY